MFLIDVETPKIEGESQSKNTVWDKKIQADTMSYDISQQTTQSSGSGLVAGGANVGHMQISKSMDKSTPFLFYYLASGTPLEVVHLRHVRAGSSSATYGGLYEAETYDLKNVIVSSYHTSGAMSGDGLPMESWTLAFTQIQETYKEINAKGMEQPAQPVGFHFGTGQAV